MIVKDILKNPIVPFEIDDRKILLLFSYFLHLAPTIDSRSAGSIPKQGLQGTWCDYLDKSNIAKESYRFYAPGYITEDQLTHYSLSSTSSIPKRTARFVCCLKLKNETELECILRHIRNSIAHSNVYFYQSNRKKYIIFDDYNTRENQTARILLTQTNLATLKKYLSS